jgi:hypothetical protein
MSKETKDPVEVPVPYKSVLIVGSHIKIHKDILDLYKQAGYLLIGNEWYGWKDLKYVSLEMLKGKISPDTKININAHGIVIKGEHHIDFQTKDFLVKLASYAPSTPLNIHLYSCYAGAAAPDVTVLPEGSTFVAHGEREMISSGSSARIMYESNKDISITNPALQFASKFLLNIGQMATIAIKKEGEDFKYTIRSPKKILSQPEEIIRYFTAERLNFVTEYNKAFPSSTINTELLPAITIDEAFKWKEDFNEYSLTGPRYWSNNADYGKKAELSIINQLKTFFDIDVGVGGIAKLPFFEPKSYDEHSQYALLNKNPLVTSSEHLKLDKNPLTTSFEYLQQAYDKGSTPLEQKENAKGAFAKLIFENGGIEGNKKFINAHKIQTLEGLITANKPGFIEEWINKCPEHFNDKKMAKLIIDLCDDNQVSFAHKAKFLSAVKKAYNKSWRSDIDIKELDACEDRLRHSNTEYLLMSEGKEILFPTDSTKVAIFLQQVIAENDLALINKLTSKPDFVVEMNDNLKSHIIKFATDHLANINEHNSFDKQLEILDLLQKLDVKTNNVLKVPLYPPEKITLSQYISEEVELIKNMQDLQSDTNKHTKPASPSSSTSPLETKLEKQLLEAISNLKKICQEPEPKSGAKASKNLEKSPTLKGKGDNHTR